MTEISLPELPPPALVNTQVPQCWFTADQMMEFARDTVRIDRLTSLPSKPAASEGDGKPLVPPCDACGGRGCIDHGDTEIGSALFDCEECDGSGLANTSKQAAGEVVALSDSEEAAYLAKRGFYDGPSTLSADIASLTTPPRHPADEGMADALRIAEAALADIGDADREPGDDVAWCERRAAQALPAVRAAIKAGTP